MTDEKKIEDTVNGSENSEYDTTQDESVEVANFSETSVGSVKAELVRMSQSGAQKIVATEVEIKQGACGNHEAQNVNIY